MLQRVIQAKSSKQEQAPDVVPAHPLRAAYGPGRYRLDVAAVRVGSMPWL
ncbi:hypothetical protein [Streptosporangium sp. NPDC003464]